MDCIIIIISMVSTLKLGDLEIVNANEVLLLRERTDVAR